MSNEEKMWNVISLGAGVQSSTMALMASVGEITPKPDFALFADTQAEPKAVYEFLDYLEGLLTFPVHRVTRGSLTKALTTLRERRDGQGYWMHAGVPAFLRDPETGKKGIQMRGCTTSYKVEVLDKNVKQLCGVKRGQKHVTVTQWIGISVDEAQRMKPNRNPWGRNIWPLIDKGMSRQDCLRWMAAWGFRRPPRSACVFCPYHSDAEWLRMQREDPDSFKEAVRVDYLYRDLKMKAGTPESKQRSVPYLHASRVPLDQVEFKDLNPKADMFGQECEGLCGV